MKTWQYLLGGLVVIGIAVQFVPSELPPVQTSNPGDLIGSGIVEEPMANILKSACYDCHSNETNYPWYSHVAPVSWLVAKDTREGREEVNFSNWQDLELLDQLAILDDISSEVSEEQMPMPIYTWIHPEAKLDENQRQQILAWAETTMDKLVEDEEE